MKLKAFTLMELLVAMVLTALLSVAGLYAWQLIQLQYLNFEKTNNTVQAYQHFSTLLLADTERSFALEIEGQDLFFLIDDLLINYKFEKNKVIRSEVNELIQPDTFNVNVVLEEALFEKEHQISGLVDQAKIQLLPFKEPQQLYLVKQYSAAQLYQLTNYEY